MPVNVSVQPKTQFVFLLLVLSQAAHSVEEYVTRLYEAFAPARWVSSLVSSDLRFGFLVANIILAGIALLCWAFPVRLGWRSSSGIMWFWAILELINGLSHSFFALYRGGYFSGVGTAPLLLVFSVWLIMLQSRRLQAK